MIQAEIRLFVISFPSVKHVILETLLSHYLMLARWGTSWRLLQHIQDSISNSVTQILQTYTHWGAVM